MLADLLGGPDIIIVIVVIALLVGSSQIPKIARSLGSAQTEFKKGLDEGKAASDKPETPSSSSEPNPAAEKDPKNS